MLKRLLNGNGILRHGVHFCHLHDEQLKNCTESVNRATNSRNMYEWCSISRWNELSKECVSLCEWVFRIAICALNIIPVYTFGYVIVVVIISAALSAADIRLFCLHCYWRMLSPLRSNFSASRGSEPCSDSVYLCDIQRNLLLRFAIRGISSQLVSVCCRWW